MSKEIIYDNRLITSTDNKQFPNSVDTIQYIDKNWDINAACFDIIHPHPKLGVGTIIPPNNGKCCIRSRTVIDLTGSVILSKGVLIQESVKIFTHTHSWKHSTGDLNKSKTWVRDLSIGKDVFIGVNALIIGIKVIGEGAIIGAGSVITKDIGPYDVWVGNPAKKIRVRGEV